MEPVPIDAYEAGGQILRDAVAGLTADQFRWVPPAEAGIGLWSVHQVVVHVADSDDVSIHRMKRIIAEPNPLLLGYDESAFARSLYYHEQPVEDALARLKLGRRAFSGVLRRLPPAAFARTGVHSERGLVRLGDLVADYVRHVDDHVRYIRLKRDALGA
ncbi:MAG: hypothetical protein JWO31_4000 [Phycisphaerales bacterium]|nr:hypothetical protein [Phycisphaerales bacterium]